MKSLLKVAILASTVVMSGTLSGSAMAQRGDVLNVKVNNNVGPTVDLSVTGEVTSAPDIASFTTGVETLSLKARDAIRLNNDKMQKVVAGLKAQGIAEKDVQTSAISLSKEYTYVPSGKNRFKGYMVRNTVTVKLRDMNRLGDMLDMLASGGATEFEGPNFSLDDDSKSNAAARDTAWTKANAIAMYHAQKAGYTSVRVESVGETLSSRASEPKYEQRAMAVANDAAADTSTPIAAGEITTSVTLSISYQMIK